MASNLKEEMLQDVVRNTADINRLTHTVEDLAHTVNKQATQTANAISSLAKQQSDSHQELLVHINKQEINVAHSQKTNWQTIAALGGVFVGIMTLLMTLMVVIGNMALTPMDREINETRGYYERHEERIDNALIEVGKLQAENKTLYLLLDVTRKEIGLKGINITISK